MTRAMRSREAHTEETRHLILAEAKRLFMSLGYRAVSTRMVADACQLTQPALYHHFSGKEDLYVAVLMEELAHLEVGLSRIASRNESGRERLYRVARFLIERTDYDISLMLHDIRSELSGERSRLVSERFLEAMLAPIVIVLQTLADEGELKSAGELHMVSMHLAMYFLYQLGFVVRPRPATARHQAMADAETGMDRAEQVVDLFLNGVGKH